ncbi:MAG: lysophospholipid acyltransferase family protein [Bacteroidaceae bacterium]|nr:lysophospholipid acyltransferase family protein [Bacteroidaceae bacterium]
MEKGLKWHQKMGLELLWIFSLIVSHTPRFFKYYILKPIVAFILILSQYRHKVIISNLTNSFPEKSEKEIKKIARRYYFFMGEVVIDTINLVGASEKRKDHVVEWVNAKETNEKQQGKDWIAMGAHYGCWEYLLLLSRQLDNSKLIGVYHPMASIVFEYFYRRLRNVSDKLIQVPMKQTILHFLRNRKNGYGTVMGLVADQSPTLRPDTHWFKFLNQHTAFHDGGEAMALKFNLPVYFAYSKRIAPGRYIIRFDEIYDGKEEVAPYEITERYVRKLESMINECPEIWMWSHRRWKQTPERQALRFGKSTLQ